MSGPPLPLPPGRSDNALTVFQEHTKHPMQKLEQTKEILKKQQSLQAPINGRERLEEESQDVMDRDGGGVFYLGLYSLSRVARMAVSNCTGWLGWPD